MGFLELGELREFVCVWREKRGEWEREKRKRGRVRFRSGRVVGRGSGQWV